MAGQLDLTLLIRTIADARGIQTTNAEIEKLAANMKEAAGAGGSLNTSVEDIVKGLQGTGKAAEESAKGADIFSRALERIEKQGSGVTEEMRKQAQEAERNILANEKVARAAESTAKQLGVAKLGFSGLKDVISGGLNGNILQAGEGVLKIAKAAAEAGPKLASLFGQLARGGAAGGAITAPFFIIAAAVRLHANDLEKSFKQILEAQRGHYEKRKALLEAETAVIQAEYAKQIKAAQEAADAAEKSQARTTAAYERAAKLAGPTRELRDVKLDNAEKKALKAAQSDEQRDRIRRDFARQREGNATGDKITDINSQDSESDIQIGKANDAITDAVGRNRTAQERVRDAQREFDLATEGAKPFKRKLGSNGFEDILDVSDQARSARDRGINARAKLDEAKKQAGLVGEETTKTIQANQAIIDQAKDTKEIVALQREILKALLEQKAKEQSATGATREDLKDAGATKELVKDVTGPTSGGTRTAVTGPDGITRTITTPKGGSGGTITKGGEAIHVDAADTVEKLRNAEASAAQLNKAVGQFAEKTTKDNQDTARRVKREAEKSGGG